MIEMLAFQILLLILCGVIHLVCLFLLDTRFRVKAFKTMKIMLYVSLAVTVLHVIFVPTFDAKMMSVFSQSLWIMMMYEPLVFPSPRYQHRVWPVSEQFGKKVMYPNLVIFFITFLYALKAGYIFAE
ncbi:MULTISPECIES: hypothetical protein [Thermoactinomyces]|jgi:hypothetical protein|uniref:Uncharacterized protein n=1 Tax=Thermoactinomyces vulgaris TaxID=2026 RepID=A0ABS0QIQ5_THEVU|nr:MULTISPECIES: hypothetical protein [Thermoactinomyces]KFZ40747.1 hypothetical protein JS81_05775 [Thermoactinomyces sp. Gus2-1]KYQ87143.1 hypothetical protein AYX07_00050 [Thermoactinomyces sp. AS95]MBA4552195.1 hypothetical protein [Thermoactinomyces vulgaris]MBA4597315.1 hypothetical protein [Thermoactinomyces vulgaris]MBH8584268.1 hypothetical protein [Thermoactinomyces sp. CICC 10735]